MKKLVMLSFLMMVFAFSGLAYATKSDDFNRALIDQDIAKVRTLLSEGVDVNMMILDGTQTSLHWAAFVNDPELASLLIEKGAKIDAKNKDGLTPLYVTAVKGSGKVLKLLLEKGANVNVKDQEGLSPLRIAIKIESQKGLQHAAKERYKEVVELLKSKGATE